MVEIRALALGAVCGLMTLAGCERGADESKAGVETVHIPGSAVKNQGALNICWAYTLSALMEARELNKGRTLDLSEEYLGFHNAINELFIAAMEDKPAQRLAGFSLGASMTGALEAIELAGTVPESVFNFKFSSSSEDFDAKIRAYFTQKFQNPATLASFRADPENLRKAFDAFLGKRLPRPDETFTYGGRTFTAKTFASDYLEFRASDYQEVMVKPMRPEDLDTALHALKVSLVQGIPVPVGVTTFPAASDGAVWDPRTCEGTCDAGYGHAMLAVDFVTEGGTSGTMPESDLKRVVHNPVKSLIVKNSWGLQGADQTGQASGRTDRLGYNVLTRAYLKEALKHMAFSFIVPKTALDEEQALIEAGLRTALVVKDLETDFASTGETVGFSLRVLDLPQRGGAVRHQWSVADASGQVISRQDGGAEFAQSFANPGIYDVFVESSAGSARTVATYRIWVANAATPTFASVSNQMHLEGDGPTRRLVLDASRPQATPDLLRSAAELPAIHLRQGGRAALQFKVHIPNKDNSLFPQIRMRVNGQVTDALCGSDLLSEKSAVEQTYVVHCPYPLGGGAAAAGETVQFLFEAHQMPQPEHKSSGVAYVEELNLRVAGGSLEPAADVAARYPQDSHYKVFLSTGEYAALTAELAPGADAARVFLDGREIATLDALQATPDGWRAATHRLQFEKPGFHTLRIAALEGGALGGHVDYALYVAPVYSFEPGQRVGQTLAGKSPFVTDGTWLQTDFGLSPGRITANGKPSMLANNLAGTATLRLDLSRHRSLRLRLETMAELEADWDFFYVRASADGGKTFVELARDTGSHPWKVLTADLSPFVGNSDVIVTMDIVTDVGGESGHYIVRRLAFE